MSSSLGALGEGGFAGFDNGAYGADVIARGMRRGVAGRANHFFKSFAIAANC